MIPKSGNRFSDKIMRKHGMRRMQRIVLLVALVAIAPVMAGCENFDPDKFDFFGLNDKKKLPGDRKAVFPEGVPGVSQGIPPEFIKGNQPPPENAALTPLPVEPAKKNAALDPSDNPKPKPKRKAKPRAAAAPAQSQGEPQAQQPPQQSGGAAWPAPGTVSR
jgi:hypothetical protein